MVETSLWASCCELEKPNHPGLVAYGEKMSLCAVFTPMSLNKAQFYSKLASQPSIKLPLMVQTNYWLKCHWHCPGCALSPACSTDSSQQCAVECVKTVFSLGKQHYRVWFSKAQACFLWYLSFCSLRSAWSCKCRPIQDFAAPKL